MAARSSEHGDCEKLRPMEAEWSAPEDPGQDACRHLFSFDVENLLCLWPLNHLRSQFNNHLHTPRTHTSLTAHAHPGDRGDRNISESSRSQSKHWSESHTKA